MTMGQAASVTRSIFSAFELSFSDSGRQSAINYFVVRCRDWLWVGRTGVLSGNFVPFILRFKFNFA